jgi:hypothetical protein
MSLLVNCLPIILPFGFFILLILNHFGLLVDFLNNLSVVGIEHRLSPFTPVDQVLSNFIGNLDDLLSIRLNLDNLLNLAIVKCIGQGFSFVRGDLY